MTEHGLFQSALGVSDPWFVKRVEFDETRGRLTIHLDFRDGARFTHGERPGEYPVHDVETRRVPHSSFFQHECELEVRIPRIRLPAGRIVPVVPPWQEALRPEEPAEDPEPPSRPLRPPPYTLPPRSGGGASETLFPDEARRRRKAAAAEGIPGCGCVVAVGLLLLVIVMVLTC